MRHPHADQARSPGHPHQAQTKMWALQCLPDLANAPQAAAPVASSHCSHPPFVTGSDALLFPSACCLAAAAAREGVEAIVQTVVDAQQDMMH